MEHGTMVCTHIHVCEFKGICAIGARAVAIEAQWSMQVPMYWLTADRALVPMAPVVSVLT